MNMPAITHINDLTPDPKNARKHSARNVGTIADALREVGAARSIVIDENNVVLAGNATIEAAADAGITKVHVVEADGNTVVAVRRTGLTPQQKARLALYDNRAAELAEGWDVDVLQALQADGVDLSAFWQEDELAALYAAECTPTVGQTDPDAVPAERHTDIVTGDVFALGRHRLVCGDARQLATIEAAMAGTRADGMWTDPPFGVSYVGKTSEALVVHGDAESDLAPLLRDVFAAADRVLTPGAAIYVVHPAGRNAVVFGQAFLAVGWHFHQGLVWVKNAMVLGHSDFHFQHESIIYGWKTGAPHTWLSDRTQVTVFLIDRPKASLDHPTSKPVALVLQQISHNVAAGGVIVEPFAGSGSTLVAAEQLGISCRAVELSPAYCQVIIDRWEAFVGNGAKAVKVGEAVHACQGQG
jgi:DNA modification methylase